MFGGYRFMSGRNDKTSPDHRCPYCGFWNDPSASASDDTERMFCNGCRRMFRIETPVTRQEHGMGAVRD